MKRVGVRKGATVMQDIDCVCACREKLPIEEKRRVFAKFYALGSHESQNAYLLACTEFTHTQEFPNRRQRRHFQYKLRPSIGTVMVCQKFFLGLDGIRRSRLRKKVGSATLR